MVALSVMMRQVCRIMVWKLPTHYFFLLWGAVVTFFIHCVQDFPIKHHCLLVELKYWLVILFKLSFLRCCVIVNLQWSTDPV